MPSPLTARQPGTLISAIDIAVKDIKTTTRPPPSPGSFLPLTPAVFHILLALSEGERHGYAIMQGVTLASEGQIRMGPGTLYGTIKRLLGSGFIEESDERPDPALDDERRRYYRLTGLGRTVLEAETHRYQALVRAARSKGLVPRPIVVTGP